MNDLQKAYCDGATMAYKDAAAKMRQIINDAPPSLHLILRSMEPFAECLERKALEVHRECERFNGIRQ